MEHDCPEEMFKIHFYYPSTCLLLPAGYLVNYMGTRVPCSQLYCPALSTPHALYCCEEAAHGFYPQCLQTLRSACTCMAGSIRVLYDMQGKGQIARQSSYI